VFIRFSLTVHVWIPEKVEICIPEKINVYIPKKINVYIPEVEFAEGVQGFAVTGRDVFKGGNDCRGQGFCAHIVVIGREVFIRGDDCSGQGFFVYLSIGFRVLPLKFFGNGLVSFPEEIVLSM
jgi:hypothetical protein